MVFSNPIWLMRRICFWMRATLPIGPLVYNVQCSTHSILLGMDATFHCWIVLSCIPGTLDVTGNTSVPFRWLMHDWMDHLEAPLIVTDTHTHTHTHWVLCLLISDYTQSQDMAGLKASCSSKQTFPSGPMKIVGVWAPCDVSMLACAEIIIFFL